jgi:hypothetical protein
MPSADEITWKIQTGISFHDDPCGKTSVRNHPFPLRLNQKYMYNANVKGYALMFSNEIIPLPSGFYQMF